jgi:nitroimidazol reductase NimA-like FMN-containing flavoprotein (pyridoxamine 5'-phosphate oxidase superfamily)
MNAKDGDMKQQEGIPTITKKGSVSVPERLIAFDKREHFAVLATEDNGQPYTSLVSYAMAPGLNRIIFATPRKTQKYRNIMQSKNVALLIDNRTKKGKTAIMGAEAITVVGIARPLRRGKKWEEMAAIFLKKHAGLEGFVRADTTALIIVDAIRCIHVGQFQTVSVWNCSVTEV